jgi:hypothetical protein
MRVISNSRRLNPFYLLRKSNNNIFQYLPKGENYFITSSGRGGLEVCINILKLTPEDTVLLPTFVAEGVISPFIKKKINVDFYRLKHNLIVDLEYLESEFRNDSSIKVIVVIHYFGFAQPIKEIKELCKKYGVVLIEDCAQSLFSRHNDLYLGSAGDISLFSLAKTIPVPDGSLFIINNSDINIPKIEFQMSLQYLLHIVFHMFTLVWAYLCGQHNGRFLSRLFNKALYSYQIYYLFLKKQAQPAPISVISRCLLSKLDYQEIINSRKRNADFFYKHVNRAKYQLLFPEYPAEAVLMGIPVILKNRDQIKTRLFEKGISCPVFDGKSWDYIPQGKRDKFEAEARFIGHHLIIPTCQDITIKEMAFITKMMNDMEFGENQ